MWSFSQILFQEKAKYYERAVNREEMQKQSLHQQVCKRDLLNHIKHFSCDRTQFSCLLVQIRSSYKGLSVVSKFYWPIVQVSNRPYFQEQMAENQRQINHLLEQNKLLSERLEMHSRDTLDTIQKSGSFNTRCSHVIHGDDICLALFQSINAALIFFL